MLPPLDAQPSSQMQHRSMLAQLLCQSERSDTEAAHVAEGHRRAGRASPRAQDARFCKSPRLALERGSRTSFNSETLWLANRSTFPARAGTSTVASRARRRAYLKFV
jgi:hypothetical protein